MRAMSLALVTLVVSGSVAAAQTATTPRIDGEYQYGCAAAADARAKPSSRWLCTESVEPVCCDDRSGPKG